MLDLTVGELAKAVAGPIVSACIAALVAYLISRRTLRTQQRISRRTLRTQQRITIDSMMNKAIEMAMQYPHLERETYCNAWPPDLGATPTKEQMDDRDRYYSYCCYVFNLILATWAYGGKKVTDTDDLLAFREYILRHRRWWAEEPGNVHFYTQEFRNFVNGVIDEEARRAVGS